MHRTLVSLFVLFAFCRSAAAQEAKLLSAKGDAAAQYISLGEACLQKKDYVAAIRYFDQARPLLQRAGDEARLGQVLKKSGDVYFARSFFREAVEQYREAVNLLRKSGQTALAGDCLERLAEINANFGHTENAIKHYTNALVIKERLNDEKGALFCRSMLARLYFLEKDYASALKHNETILKQTDDDTQIKTDAAIQQIVLLTFLGRTEAAEENLPLARRLTARQHNSANDIKLFAAISNMYLARRDHTNAKIYRDSGIMLLNGTRNPELAVIALQQMAEIHKNNGDYKAAYEAAASMDRYKDVFRTENIQRLSAEIKDAAEAALREKEIELKETQLSKEKVARLALWRENILKDSAFAGQTLLLKALEKEAQLRDSQLLGEKELSLSLTRENQLKQRLLDDERRSRNMLYAGLAALALLGGVIYYQFRKQRQQNAIIRKQTEELAVLNKEIHHRVKNNLQVISSMLDLQSQTLDDEKATAVIKEAILRVQSMAFIHQNLYRDNAVNSVNMTEYIAMLSNHLFATYNIRAEKIKLHTEIENIDLHTDTAIPLGMILNELISNALKYAFKNRETGNLHVRLRKNADKLFLQVKDDGVGLPQGFDYENTASFGYEVIRAFAQKLRARVQIEGAEGVDVQIIISKFKTTASA